MSEKTSPPYTPLDMPGIALNLPLFIFSPPPPSMFTGKGNLNHQRAFLQNKGADNNVCTNEHMQIIYLTLSYFVQQLEHQA